jgi:Zn-dependent protease
MGSRIFQGPAFLLFEFLRNPTPENGVTFVIRLFSVLAIIFILFPIHESAHAYSAKLLGDDTADREGRLTLNPFAHIDPIGAICLFFLPLGWAKPVPVDPRNATRKVTMRGFMSLTAAAGPVSNVLLSLVFVIIAKIIALGSGTNEMMHYLYLGLMITAQISIYLAVFNLIPIPPLDGSKILMFFLSNRASYTLERNSHIIRMGLLISMLVLPPSYNPLLILLRYISSFIMLGLDYATFFLGVAGI